MMELKVEGLAELERALATAREEIPRAARNALNDTARAIQSDFRATLPGKFVLRRKQFAERQVYFGNEDKATKEKLEARLRIQGPAGKVSTLAKFELLGEKRAREGRLAIPARGIRSAGGHVKAGYAFKNFMPLVEMGGQYTKLRRRRGRLVAGKTLTSKAQLVGRRGSFVVTLPSGDQALVRRERGSRAVELLYTFRPITPIPRSLEFVQDATKSANHWMPRKIAEAIDYALQRASLK